MKLPSMPKMPKKGDMKNLKKGENSTPIWSYVLAFFLAGAIIYALFFRGADGISTTQNKDVSLPKIVATYSSGMYEKVVISGNYVEGFYPTSESVVNGKIEKKQTTDMSMIPPGTRITDLGLSDPTNKTPVNIKDNSWYNIFKESLASIISTLVFLAIAIFLFSRISIGGPGGPMGFGRSKAKMYDPDADDKVTFVDVAGAEEEKEDLMEIVDFLKNPDKYKEIGAKIPRGILMSGPPGTGKTLLARAVAGEAGVPFFSISGSEFVEMFVGVGASRVRDLFEEAREQSPSIIFIDEIDAIGKRRQAGMGGGHDEREQTLNQILTEMDGFDNDTAVIVMAATNRADVLDRALLRPGRFDRKVTISLPTLEDREKILVVHSKGKPLAADVDMRRVAGITIGFSGAELGNLLNEAAILAGKNGDKEITAKMIQKSIEKVVMGNEKKSLRMTDGEKRLTALHEVGHAIVGKMLAHTDPVHKISILPRGGAGGVTWFLPEKDRTYTSKAKFVDELATLYGGRVAEEIFLGRDYITTGASSDIEKATSIARAMVMKYGFDAELGAENFAPDDVEGNYLGAETEGKAISDDTKKVIDRKVRDILQAAYATATHIITTHRVLHEHIADVLLQKEEMLKEEFDAFFVDVDEVPQKKTL